MAGSKTLKLRRFWLQIHKWIGILLTVLLIPLGLSGSALVWDEQLDTLFYPQRHVSSADSRDNRPAIYIERAKPQLGPDDRIALLRACTFVHGIPAVFTGQWTTRSGRSGEPGVPGGASAPATRISSFGSHLCALRQGFVGSVVPNPRVGGG